MDNIQVSPPTPSVGLLIGGQGQTAGGFIPPPPPALPPPGAVSLSAPPVPGGGYTSLYAELMRIRTTQSTRRNSQEDYGHLVENDFLAVKQNPYSTFSIDVDTAAYANVRRLLNESQIPPKDAIRTEELVNYFAYDYPQPVKTDPFSISTEMSDCPWAPEHRLVSIGLQGRKAATENLPASNLVFLIDVSGSMCSPDKLPLLKKSFAMLVEKLRPQDRVSFVTYAGASGLVLPPTAGSEKRTI
ncbi:MAG: von Willebrand factor type A domain-containing protein, partial [Cyanobacteria bacterium]|nr:von Willebrand factor type A domain-containing protein [Cyanobacteriota bacterium]